VVPLSPLLACTLIVSAIDALYLRYALPVSVTTPVLALMAKRPPALSVKVYVAAGPLGSVEDAVRPTTVPLAAPSATLLAATFASVGAVGFMLLTAIVNVCVDVPGVPLASSL